MHHPISGKYPSRNFKKRSIRVFGAPENRVEKLSVRRDTATKCELECILTNEQHPCHKYLPLEHNKHYNQRRTRKYAAPKT